MTSVRVLLAEDHRLVRAGIHALLDRMAGVEVVGEVSDGVEALKAVEAIQPDLVLMDVAMPGLNGLEAASRISKQWPAVRIIMLSMHANEEYLRQALKAGAMGYLLKGADLVELEQAIRTVSGGASYLTPSVARHLIDPDREGDVRELAPVERLSPRQREILQLIAEGHSTKEMAYRLKLRAKTVETHRAQLMARLDIHDIAGLVRFAIKAGLTHPSS
jgi:DNA-binding NarL/FixJ family response regulator